jgi:hypothetical protein
MSKLANENSPTQIQFSTVQLLNCYQFNNFDLFFTDIFTTFTEKSSKLA